MQVDYAVASTVDGVTEAVEGLGGRAVAKNVTSGPIESNCHLVVCTNAVNDTVTLTNLADSVKAGGFVLCVEDIASKTTVAERAGLTQIMKLQTDVKVVFLFRKVNELTDVLSF